MQAIGRELRAIDYYEASGLPLAHYVEVLKAKAYAYDSHIMPHDAGARELGNRQDRSRSCCAASGSGADRAQA